PRGAGPGLARAHELLPPLAASSACSDSWERPGSSRSSQRGIHQHHLPSQPIAAGTKTSLTMKASMKMPIDCATPKLRIEIRSDTEKARKTEIMISAAPVTT